MATHEQIIDEAIRLIGEGMKVTLPVKGHSMFPFITGDSDSVILQKPRMPRIGDVVLAFVDGKRYVIHRIISIDSDGIRLMGDGNLTATECCTTSDIKAIATHKVRRTDRAIDLYTRRQRFLSWLWRLLRPIRRYLLGCIAICINQK